jgi:ABC-type Fe3+/spermidine/putrescine transport system ATPase subunit
MPDKSVLLSIQNVTKRFGDKLALDRVSVDIVGGEIFCLLGPSGCGKTTLLRIVAGLERPDAGQLFCQGQALGSIRPHERDFGLMFQDFALFPHKNVFDNVAFGLRMRARLKDGAIKIRVQEMLALVGLEGFEQRSVNDLSGGEAQRVALARSLAPRPQLLMLDEPLGSLDRALRERLMIELRDILKHVGVTTLYVTHDQAEAFAIADRAVVMQSGRIEQVGRPEEIYRRPATRFVAHFLGLTNLAEGQVIAPGRVASDWGELAAPTADHQPGQQVSVLIRPEAVTLTTTDLSRPSPNRLCGQLLEYSFRGGRYRVKVQPEMGPPLTFELTRASPLIIAADDPVSVELDPAGVVLMAAAGEIHN